MEQTLRDSLWQTRLTVALFGAFSALALVLAAVGIYGLTSHAVEQRTREIGLRAALGATPADVLNLVLRRGLVLAAAGVAGGLVAAWSFARVISGMLFNVAASDLSVYLAVPAVLLMVAALANLVPAVKAARSDPAAALRHE